jgi:hypothetical protein
MEKINTVKSLFPHLPERLAGLEELASGRTNALQDTRPPGLEGKHPICFASGGSVGGRQES